MRYAFYPGDGEGRYMCSLVCVSYLVLLYLGSKSKCSREADT